MCLAVIWAWAEFGWLLFFLFGCVLSMVGLLVYLSGYTDLMNLKDYERDLSVGRSGKGIIHHLIIRRAAPHSSCLLAMLISMVHECNGHDSMLQGIRFDQVNLRS